MLKTTENGFDVAQKTLGYLELHTINAITKFRNSKLVEFVQFFGSPVKQKNDIIKPRMKGLE